MFSVKPENMIREGKTKRNARKEFATAKRSKRKLTKTQRADALSRKSLILAPYFRKSKTKSQGH